jgi:hypothetical protein
MKRGFLVDFTEEKAIIDKYVDIKDSGAGEDLMLELIENHFIPQNRFEEARSWKSAIKDKGLRSKADELLKSAIKNSRVAPISRIPQNEEWTDESPAAAAHQSDDQQYHYDRTVSYSNAVKMMLDDIDDVRVCRNEWITFMARHAYEGGLDKMGAEFDTLAMALSDYIEFILLPGDFFSDDVNTTPAHAKGTTVEEAYDSRPEMITYLAANASPVLNSAFWLNFFCRTGVNGAVEEVIVTEDYLVFVPKKKTGWNAGKLSTVPTSSITSISVGSEYHTEYQGITSYSQSFWTLTFVTDQYQQFTRWLYLGRNEAEMNQNRPQLGQTMERLAEHFQLTEGDSFQSSGGYTTSIGFGFWV